MSPISINGRVATLSSGVIGIQLYSPQTQAGRLYAAAGIGYSPRETISYFGATVSGSANASQLMLGYRIEKPISYGYGLFFDVSNQSNEIDGDFSGSRGALPLQAKVNASFDFTLTKIGISKRLNASTVKVVFGKYDWDVRGNAFGRFDNGITAVTDVAGDGDF